MKINPESSSSLMDIEEEKQPLSFSNVPPRLNGQADASPQVIFKAA